MRAQDLGRIVALGLFLMASAGHADTAAAAAAYKRAQAAQAGKQWGAAVKEYQAALAADPKYVWAYKGLGTTYYQAGDKRGALAYYDKYLAANPSDAPTRAFATKLRAELNGGAAPEATAQPEAAKTPEKSPVEGLDFGLDLSGLMAGADDLNKLVGTGPGAKTFTGTFGFGFGAHVDYGLAGGFVIGAKLGLGPNRSHSLDFGGGSKYQVDINNTLIMLSPGYRFVMGSDSWIEARLDVGMLLVSETGTSTFAGTSVSSKATGSGFGFIPQVAYAKKFSPNWGMSVGLGYMISSVSPLTDDKGHKIQVYSTSGTASDFALTTGGLDILLGFNYFL